MDISAQRQIYIPLQEQSFSNQQRVYQPAQQPQQIIVNQPINPQVIYIDTSNLRNSPCSMTCPYCNGQISTEVKKSFNWFNCVFCLWAGFCCWTGMQLCKNKELNCYDSEHFCPTCHNKIGDYSSC